MPVYAPIVERPDPYGLGMRNYYDCRQWGGGFQFINRIPGAVAMNDKGQMIRIDTGEVYYDERFNKEKNP